MSSRTPIALLAAAVLACGAAGVCGAAQEDVFERVRTYEFGQSTAPLDAVRQQVRANLGDPDARRRLARRLADVLQGDSTFAARRFACRQLALIGTEEQVPALAALLDADHNLSHAALYALAHIDSPAVGRALRRALDQTSGRTRVGIINCLGRRRDGKAIEKLADILHSAEGDEMRAAAAALGDIGGRAARRALTDVLSGRKGSVRTPVADALMECADRLVDRGRKEAAAEIYRLVWEGDHPSTLRAAGLTGLAGALPAEQGSPMLLEALSGPDSAVRDAAGWLVRELPGTEATRALAGRLSDVPDSSKVLVLSALGDRGDAAALPAVRRACEDESAGVRAAAVRALGRLGRASEVPFLARRAVLAGGEERQAARESLRTLSGGDVNGRMTAMLDGAGTDVAAELIRALADRGAAEATDALLDVARSGRMELRTPALRALSALGTRRDLPALLDLVSQSGAEQRGAVESAVLAVLQRLEDGGSVETVIDRYESAGRIEVRRSWLRILAGVGGGRALEVLRGAMDSGQPEIRITAVRALSEWPDPAPRGDLLEVARRADDAKERTLALRGYIRMIKLDSSLSTRETVEMYRKAFSLTPGPGEVVMILSGLGEVNSPAALRMAEERLDGSAVRGEAALAVVSIARRICGSYPDRCRRAMERVLEVAESDSVRSQARGVLQTIRNFGDYITAWQVAGPYRRAGADEKKLFDVAFPPEKSPEQVQWRIMPVGGQQSPWILNLMTVFGGSNRAAYLRTRVWSPSGRRAVLELGSDDGIKAWLNGNVVHVNNTNRGLQPGQDKVRVALQEGWNSLMLKVTQGGGGWAACARFRAPGGSPLDGLRFEVPGGPEAGG